MNKDDLPCLLSKMHHKHKGARNELGAICWLLDRGYEVFRNVSQHGPIDVIAVKGSEILFFDVKSEGASTASGTKDQIGLGVSLLRPTPDGDFLMEPFRDMREVDIKCMECGNVIDSIQNPRSKNFCSRICRSRFWAEKYRQQKEGAKKV